MLGSQTLVSELSSRQGVRRFFFYADVYWQELIDDEKSGMAPNPYYDKMLSCHPNAAICEIDIHQTDQVIDLRLDSESDFFKNFENFEEKQEKWKKMLILPHSLYKG